MATAKKSLNTRISQAIKGSFDLDKFKKTKHLDQSSNFKKQKWIPFRPALQDALSIPGIPMGQITIARGGSDTGKTTLLIEAAVEAQKMGILPGDRIVKVNDSLFVGKKITNNVVLDNLRGANQGLEKDFDDLIHKAKIVF
jgi:hypothetical protein